MAETPTDKIKKLFDTLTPEAQGTLLHELMAGKKKVDVDTSIISSFAQRHQKEYQSDITFTITKGDKLITAELKTLFGPFKGTGTNQKIAKINAIQKAEKAWKD